jgi:hypothetical protein
MGKESHPSHRLGGRAQASLSKTIPKQQSCEQKIHDLCRGQVGKVRKVISISPDLAMLGGILVNFGN